MTFSVISEDRISNLPDCLISHILSCLPTKDAIRTSVLSKVWEYKWTSISKIDINKDDYQASFANIMERLILHALGIKCVRLQCDAEQDSVRLTSWVSALLRRRIETFDLTCVPDDFVIPRSLLNKSSLRILRLVSSFFKVPERIYFANLRTLKLCHVEILNDNPNSNHLIFTFPVLETLELYCCEWLKVKFVEISAPELVTFLSVSSIHCDVDAYSIKIIGDKLKEISTGYLRENIILTGSLVVKASLTNVGFDHDAAKRGEYARNLLRGLASLVDLKLGSYPVEAMAHSRARLPFRRFEKLTKLDLFTPSSEGLLELLHASPNLKDLSISSYCIEWLWDKYENYEAEPVPSCVVSCLETVHLEGRFQVPYYHHLAKFLLVNGAQLKTAQVVVLDPFLESLYQCFECTEPELVQILKDEVRKKLSAIPKVSPCLEISVVVD